MTNQIGKRSEGQIPSAAPQRQSSSLEGARTIAYHAWPLGRRREVSSEGEKNEKEDFDFNRNFDFNWDWQHLGRRGEKT